MAPVLKGGKHDLAIIFGGTITVMAMDVRQVNVPFEALGDARPTAKPKTAPADTVFTELQVALVSVTAIGQALLRAPDQTNLATWL